MLWRTRLPALACVNPAAANSHVERACVAAGARKLLSATQTVPNCRNAMAIVSAATVSSRLRRAYAITTAANENLCKVAIWRGVALVVGRNRCGPDVAAATPGQRFQCTDSQPVAE